MHFSTKCKLPPLSPKTFHYGLVSAPLSSHTYSPSASSATATRPHLKGSHSSGYIFSTPTPSPIPSLAFLQLSITHFTLFSSSVKHKGRNHQFHTSPTLSQCLPLSLSQELTTSHWTEQAKSWTTVCARTAKLAPPSPQTVSISHKAELYSCDLLPELYQGQGKGLKGKWNRPPGLHWENFNLPERLRSFCRALRPSRFWFLLVSRSTIWKPHGQEGTQLSLAPSCHLLTDNGCRDNELFLVTSNVLPKMDWCVNVFLLSLSFLVWKTMLCAAALCPEKMLGKHVVTKREILHYPLEL